MYDMTRRNRRHPKSSDARDTSERADNKQPTPKREYFAHLHSRRLSGTHTKLYRNPKIIHWFRRQGINYCYYYCYDGVLNPNNMGGLTLSYRLFASWGGDYRAIRNSHSASLSDCRRCNIISYSYPNRACH